MLRLSGNNIFLTKGDSAYININISNSDGNPYTLQPSDNVRIQVRDNINNGKLVFEGDVAIDVEKNNILWRIVPDNTGNLYVNKDYYWDAQLETSEGDIFTFIAASKFTITPEITRKN